MKLILSHETALALWRNPDTSAALIRASPRCALPTHPLTKAHLNNSIAFKQLLARRIVEPPVHVLVANADLRCRSKNVRSHFSSAPSDAHPLYHFDRDVYCVSPELCFLQLAASRPLIHLIELGCELCGTYSLDNASPTSGFKTRPPLTTSASLATFAESLSGTHGAKAARRAARYVLDSAASPMEAKLALLLSLPCSLGGFGLPQPHLNYRITFTAAERAVSHTAFCVCDLYWPGAKLAVEYDSDEFHTGPERIAKDSRRRNALAAKGIAVITATRRQLLNFADTQKLARTVAKRLKIHARKSNFAYSPEKAELRSMLLPPLSRTIFP